MFKGIKAIIGLFFGICFIWVSYLLIKGLLVTNINTYKRDQWPQNIIGRWQSCINDSCFNLELKEDSVCNYILKNKIDSVIIPARYSLQAMEHNAKNRSIGGYEHNNEALVISLVEKNEQDMFINYRYKMIALTNNTLELQLSKDALPRVFTKY
jgi:hypothetical protein